MAEENQRSSGAEMIPAALIAGLWLGFAIGWIASEAIALHEKDRAKALSDASLETLRQEVELWKDRAESERRDHEATIERHDRALREIWERT